MKDLLAQIAELAQRGLEHCAEADRMERFLAETSRHLNALNQRIASCEVRVDVFIRRVQEAVKDQAQPKPKPKKKVGTVTLRVPKKKVRRKA